MGRAREWALPVETLALGLDGGFRAPTFACGEGPGLQRLLAPAGPERIEPAARGLLISPGPHSLDAAVVTGLVRRGRRLEVSYRLVPRTRLPAAVLACPRLLERLAEPRGFVPDCAPYHVVRLSTLPGPGELRCVREYEGLLIGRVEVLGDRVYLSEEPACAALGDGLEGLPVRVGSFTGWVPAGACPGGAAPGAPLLLETPVPVAVPGRLYRVRDPAAAAALREAPGALVRVQGALTRAAPARVDPWEVLDLERGQLLYDRPEAAALPLPRVA